MVSRLVGQAERSQPSHPRISLPAPILQSNLQRQGHWVRNQVFPCTVGLHKMGGVGGILGPLTPGAMAEGPVRVSISHVGLRALRAFSTSHPALRPAAPSRLDRLAVRLIWLDAPLPPADAGREERHSVSVLPQAGCRYPLWGTACFRNKNSSRRTASPPPALSVRDLVSSLGRWGGLPGRGIQFRVNRAGGGNIFILFYVDTC